MKLAVCTGWTWGWREAAYCVSLVRRLQTLLQFTKTLRCLLSRLSAALDVCRSWEGLAGAEALISIITDDVTGGRSSGGWPPLWKSPDPSLPCPWVLLESPAYGFLFGKKALWLGLQRLFEYLVFFICIWRSMDDFVISAPSSWMGLIGLCFLGTSVCRGAPSALPLRLYSHVSDWFLWQSAP